MNGLKALLSALGSALGLSGNLAQMAIQEAKQLVADGARAELEHVSKVTAGQLDAAHKGFPSAPTDADRADFVKHALRHLWKNIVHSGDVADLLKHVFEGSITVSTGPKLTAGLSTEAAVVLVADAQADLLANLT